MAEFGILFSLVIHKIFWEMRIAVGHFKPSRCIKTSFDIPENRLNFPTTDGFRREISMKLTLSPHDALKHHLTYLETDLIFLQLTVLEGIFP